MEKLNQKNLNHYGLFFMSTRVDNKVDIVKGYLNTVKSNALQKPESKINIATVTDSELHKEFSKPEYSNKIVFTLVDINFTKQKCKGKFTNLKLTEHLKYLNDNDQLGVFDDIMTYFSFVNDGARPSTGRLGGRLSNFITQMRAACNLSLYFVDPVKLADMMDNHMELVNPTKNFAKEFYSAENLHMFRELTFKYFDTDYVLHTMGMIERYYENSTEKSRLTHFMTSKMESTVVEEVEDLGPQIGDTSEITYGDIRKALEMDEIEMCVASDKDFGFKYPDVNLGEVEYDPRIALWDTCHSPDSTYMSELVKKDVWNRYRQVQHKYKLSPFQILYVIMTERMKVIKRTERRYLHMILPIDATDFSQSYNATIIGLRRVIDSSTYKDVCYFVDSFFHLRKGQSVLPEGMIHRDLIGNNLDKALDRSPNYAMNGF